MSTSSAHLPLELLFPRLEAAGFALNTARRLRVWRVLHGEGARFAGNMEGLKFLLCPLLARTPQEQQRFYVLFEQFWAECMKEWEEWPEGEEETTLSEANSSPALNPVVGSGPKKLKYLVWAFTAIAIIAGIFFINKNYFKEAVKSPLARFALSNEYEQGIISGDSLEIGNFSEYYDSTKVHWEIKDQATGEVLHHDSSTATSWVVPEAGKKVSIALSVLAKPGSHLPKDTSLWPDSLFATSKEEYIIHCSDIPEVGEIVSDASAFIAGQQYKFEIKAEKGCYVEWEFPEPLESSKGNTAIAPKLNGTTASNSFKKEGNYQIRARVFRENKRDYCYREVTKSITVGSNKPFLRLAELKYDHPRQILQISWLGWLLVFLPLLPALWFFYRWWKKRNETPKEKTDAELAAEYPFVDAAPYYIPYLPQEEKISVPREFFRIAEILRRREDAERREFSAQDSVKATIAAGGFPTWRDRAKTRPSDYLFLIKRPDERDQQFRLFERLTDFMTRRDAPITTYFHDGRFDRFWTAGEEKSIDLQQLNRQYSQHRLIILGDGHDLVHPTSKAAPSLLRNPALALLRWPRRLLLTPEAVSGWSYQEGLLHQIFPIFPADTDGILQGLDMLDRIEEHQPGLFEKWQEEQQHRRPEATHRYRNVSTLSSLREMLAHDSDLWRWCQALAVCAQPDWSLTIAVGRAIGVDVTHDRLLALTRVDWLRRNESDDHLRLELLKILDPVDEKAARSAVASELEQVEEQVKNGFAATEWAANLAVQRFALDPRDKAHKQSIRHLQRLGLLSGGQVAELEWIIEKDDLVSPGGEKLKRYLELPEDKPFLTWELGTTIILCISSMLLFWNARSFDLQQRPAPANLNAVPFWQVAKILDDRAIELNNQAAGIGQYIATEKSYTRWQGYAEDSKEANTLWEQAIALRQPDGYALADSNRYAHRFNAAAQLLNFYLKDSIKSNEFRTDSIALSAAAGSFMELVNGSYWNTNDSRRIEAQHAMGLCHFYLKDMAVARRAYQLIIGSNPSYFDTISMPVNLQTLLADIGTIKTLYVLRIVVLDGNTGKSIPNVVIKPKNLPSLRSDATGRATYTFPSQPASGKINATIQKAGYESWSGTLQPRTSTQTDTIRLFLPKPVALSDRDADGVLDAEDECPDIKGTSENKGCPPPTTSDSDGDGVEDKDDACPNDAGAALAKGCPDADNDGILDRDDKCPKDPGSATNQGCPSENSGDYEARLLRTFNADHEVLCIDVSPDNRRIAAGTDDQFNAIIWDISSGNRVLTTPQLYNSVSSVAFSPDGQWLASRGTSANTANIWDINTGLPILTLTGHNNVVWSVAFSPDGKYIATGSDDHTAIIWNLKSGAPILTLEGHTYYVGSVTFSPNSKYLATASSDKTVKIWDLENGKTILSLTDFTAWVTCIDYSPHGGLLAAASSDKTIIWDFKSGKIALTFDIGVNTFGENLAFSPDGKLLAIGAKDQTLKIYEISTGKKVLTIEGFSNTIGGVCFFSDGKRVATGSGDGTIKIWEIVKKMK